MAGMTTFTWEYQPIKSDCDIIVNADLIAAGPAPFRRYAGWEADAAGDRHSHPPGPQGRH